MTLRNYRQPIAIGATLLSLFLCVCGLIVTLPPAYRGLGDFRQLYTAGYMARTGQSAELHDFDASEKLQIEIVGPAVGALPFNHLAVESLFFAPFSLLSYRPAYVVFFLLNIVLLAVAFSLLRSYLSSLAEIWTLLPAATFAAFLPVTLALTQGQDSILLLLLLIAAHRALDQEHDITGGALVGLTLFKFQYGLPIALLFLAWRRWRFLAGFAASATAMIAISLALTGIGGFVAYLHSLTQMSSRFTSTYGAIYGIHLNLMPNIRGLIHAITQGVSPATLFITAALSAFVLIWTATRRPSFPLALIAAILVSYHHLITDTTMMILPAGLAFASSVAKNGNRSRRNATAVAILSGSIFVAPGLLLFADVRFYLLAIPIAALLFRWPQNSLAGAFDPTSRHGNPAVPEPSPLR
jgi:hypothetical protein